MEPADARFGRAAIIVQIEIVGKVGMPEHSAFAESQCANTADDDARDPRRHTDRRCDHRCGQHRLVEQTRITFQHGRADAAAHGMAVQVERPTHCILASDGAGECCEISYISTPVIDPDQTRIAHVMRGMAVTAMLEYAYGIACEQEVPHHLAVFASEFGETVGDDDRSAERSRRPASA